VSSSKNSTVEKYKGFKTFAPEAEYSSSTCKYLTESLARDINAVHTTSGLGCMETSQLVPDCAANGSGVPNIGLL